MTNLNPRRNYNYTIEFVWGTGENNELNGSYRVVSYELLTSRPFSPVERVRGIWDAVIIGNFSDIHVSPSSL